MSDSDDLARAVEHAGYEVFWQGAASPSEVRRLQSMLGAALPQSFRRFLEEYGGGGGVSAEISGIENNDAANASGGTVLGATFACRERYGLPGNLVVIYFHVDEVCWCLDTAHYYGDECPVVSYNIFSRKLDRTIATDFASFIRQHLQLYSNSQSSVTVENNGDL